LGQTISIPTSSVYKSWSFESFDPENQIIMRELEKDNDERGIACKTLEKENG
jgi:hypothetical protein